MTLEKLTLVYYTAMVSVLIFVLIITGIATYNTSKCDELRNERTLTHTGDS